MAKTKLELTWIGKENRPKLEPRILLEDPARSHHAQARRSDSDLFDNRLIFGDNLLALKALAAEFTGKIKCIYIDPPYNTGSAFEHYDDGVEHSLWYAPSDSLYWHHGHSTELDFIYVTTQTLTREQLFQLSEEVGENRSLLVMCSAFRARDREAFPNLTIKKIPKTVLTRCEWGKDDYSLNIKNLPVVARPDPAHVVPPPMTRAGRKAKTNSENRTLFDLE